MNMENDNAEAKKSKLQYRKNLEMLNPDAAGLDLHQETIWVGAGLKDNAEPDVKTFGTYTADLVAMGEWLREKGVTSVAMESTGVFWVAPYRVLREMGFEVMLVNAHEIKGVRGRPKTDRLDCVWICRLHAYGLLRGSFVPDGRTAALRDLWTCREKVIVEAGRVSQRINKALLSMNCRLDRVVSDIVGDSGRRIIEAILNGERDPERLAGLADARVHKPREEFILALNGDFRASLLIVLDEWYAHYLFYQGRLARLHKKIFETLERFPSRAADDAVLPPPPPHYKEDHLKFPEPLRPLFFRILGTDLTQLSGVGPALVLAFLSTVGTDVSAWPTEKHFVSWLGLSPNPQVSGGRVKRQRTKKVKNALTEALKVSALTVQRTDSFLGAAHRRLKARIGPASAKTAIARKLAIILYRLVKNKRVAIKFNAEAYEELYRERQLKKLKRLAARLGFELNAVNAAA